MNGYILYYFILLSPFILHQLVVRDFKTSSFPMLQNGMAVGRGLNKCREFIIYPSIHRPPPTVADRLRGQHGDPITLGNVWMCVSFSERCVYLNYRQHILVLDGQNRVKAYIPQKCSVTDC